MFLLEKQRFCKNYDQTLCFRTLRGDIDPPGESEFDVENIKQIKCAERSAREKAKFCCTERLNMPNHVLAQDVVGHF